MACGILERRHRLLALVYGSSEHLRECAPLELVLVNFLQTMREDRQRDNKNMTSIYSQRGIMIEAVVSLVN